MKTFTPPFDKYKLYKESVQEPEADIQLLNQVFEEIYPGRKPHVLREDFCGTFALCCEWVKLHNHNVAIGIDFDKAPIDYGKKNYLSKLDSQQSSRVHLYLQNVQHQITKKSDIICAFNFSYFSIKSRKDLKAYFRSAYEGLNQTGILSLDIFFSFINDNSLFKCPISNSAL